MTRIILLSSLALSIAGCSPADIIEGKPSAFEQNQERVALVTMPAPVQPVVAVPEPLTVAVEPEPVEPPAVEPEPIPEPVCVPVFRVVVCP